MEKIQSKSSLSVVLENAFSAVANSSTVVSSYKCSSRHTLTTEQEKFNTLLGKPRVLAEHTIGMLKGRFQFLRRIPKKITSKTSSLRGILKIIDCCIILHNLLIDCDDEIPEQWLNDILSSGEVDGIEEELGEENRFLPARYEEDDIENNDDTRRQQCLSFFKDFNFINN